MSIAELFPFLDHMDLIRLSQANKVCREVMDPQSNKCLLYEVLFSQWSPATLPTEDDWKGLVAESQAEPGATTTSVVLKMLRFMALLELKNTKYRTTYERFKSREKGKEMLGYAGSNNSMWTNDLRYFERKEIEKSTFGKPLLHLKQVCWMDPRVIVENIPEAWDTVNIDILHVRLANFNLNQSFFSVKVKIEVVNMSEIKQERIPWVTLQDKPLELPSYFKPDTLVTEPLVRNLSIPSTSRGTPFAL